MVQALQGGSNHKHQLGVTRLFNQLKMWMMFSYLNKAATGKLFSTVESR
jgi:hypothetical protein